MNVLSFSVIILSIVCYASALSCYFCNSAEEGNCDSEQLIPCDTYSTAAGMTTLFALKPFIPMLPSTSYQCYKLVAEQKITNIRLTVKGCAYGTTPVCDGVPMNADQKECRTCTGDGCNGAAGRLALTSYGLLVVLVAVHRLMDLKRF
ncbi:uncharacterized protein LOC131682159 [Topomyia yanbarensis]|uniref:uncharacterized protein LOC131682159 n=1 Tax=Topomyia yanbarensis TaxID=2498891 RepID=UPI00273C4D5A|nr:uncharacterized protein LOC131682159 [Topomyia yanbarensis]